MPVDCQRSTSGGKGNFGKFIERDSRICAAGLPSAQPDEFVADALKHYLLQEEVDALISDAIIPPPKPRPLPPLRHPQPSDKRYAMRGDVAKLVNPQMKTKIQILADDFKDTVYASYWKKRIGQVPDPVPMFPKGYDIVGTTYGNKLPYQERLYDIVMPKETDATQTPPAKKAGLQTNRKYCSPPFSRDLTYGHRTFVDKRGFYAKGCLTDDRIALGNANKSIISAKLANFQDATIPRLSTVLAPCNNIKEVPEGHTFGKLKAPCSLHECLTTCKINSGLTEFRNCLKALNTLRKCLTTKYLPTFFRIFYLNLKYFDKQSTGWLPKDVVYNFCATKLIRFKPEMIEPLLAIWHAFDGSNIEYKTFVYVLNYMEPLPELPKIEDLPADCLEFRTTYTDFTEKVKPNNSPMTGVPSGRYFDKDYPITPENYCLADRVTLPQESDMKSRLNPSMLTLLNVSHRDMYAKREPDVVRRVFEATGEKFTDERFNALWEQATKFHSQGWVCYETFRRALEGPKLTPKVDYHSKKAT